MEKEAHLIQGRRKLFYGGGGDWVKMSITMVDQGRKQSPKKRNLDQI